METFDEMLPRIGLSGRRRLRAGRVILSASLKGRRIGGIWMIRQEPGSSFRGYISRHSVGARLAAILVAHLAQYVLVLSSWWLIGRGVFGGHFDPGWLTAWVLMLLTLVLFRVGTYWLQGKLAIDLSELLKLRLLRGFLRLDLDVARHTGAGRFLSWSIESAAVQDLVLDGAFLTFLALIEAVFTLGVLAIGAVGMPHVLAFLMWFGVAMVLSWRLYRTRDRQFQERLRMTEGLTERMVGNRTRQAQQKQDDWHKEEDEILDVSLKALRLQDGWATWLEVVGIGWQIVAVAAMLPVFVAGHGTEGSMAVAVGGIILGQRAIVTFAQGIVRLGDATIAWKTIEPAFRAAGWAPGGSGHKNNHVAPDHVNSGSAVIVARNLSYRAAGRARPVLDRANLTIASGDRVLLEGPSGCGKSTFAAILSAIRAPDAGLVLIDGMDIETVGAVEWRRAIAVAPQFGENHLFSDTLAFNLLMGRQWPPEEVDLQRAENLCREMGLGDLLDRMPAGIHQMVGDTGWQLSHGERSRVFVARALLQGSEILVLDESIGPLDPESRLVVMDCVERHARTLIVIGHP
jgi:ATP-binding cassette subfamily B protein